MDTKVKKLGKYTTLISAIGALLIFIGCILGLNAYISTQVADLSRDITKVSAVEMQVADVRQIAQSYQYAADSGAAGKKLLAAANAVSTGVTALSEGTEILKRAIAASTGSASLVASEALVSIVNSWSKIDEELQTVIRRDSEQTNLAESIYPGEFKSSLAERHGFEAILPQFGVLTTAIQSDIERISRRTIILQVVGLAMSLLMFAFVTFHLLGNLNYEEEGIANARRETEEILSTVSEGLFLVNEELIIGSEFSKRLTEMFRRDDFEDMAFEDLLRDIVPEKVLTTAMDYIGLLWSDRVNENLVKTLNPLDEVQVNFDDGSGSFETLYLEFDFNRVNKDGLLSHLLVTVNDISRRVELARELEQSQADSQAQLDLLLSILYVDPRTLATFLRDSDSSMNLINATLKEPARTQTAFKDKINTIFAMVHSIKGDAAAFGLSSVEERSHVFEDMLVALRDQPNLTGNDFLPLTVRLDDLMSHVASVGSMVERLMDYRQATGDAPSGTISSPPNSASVSAVSVLDPTSHELQNGAASNETPYADDSTVKIATLVPPVGVKNDDPTSYEDEVGGSDLTQTLEQLVRRVAERQGKQVKLNIVGMEQLRIPDEHSKALRDIAIQLIRNAITHGLELPEARLAAGKNATGTVRIRVDCSHGVQIITFIDNGAGLNVNSIKAAALKKGILSVDEVDNYSDEDCKKLIFKPGFSTQSDADTDAGRGVGMDLVRRQLKEIHGRFRLKSVQGMGTAISIILPPENSVANFSAA